MTTAVATLPESPKLDAGALENVLIKADLSKLSEPQRMAYYRSVCDSLGLNALTNPFQYIVLNGKLRLYATKDATEQLRKLHGVSVTQIEKLFHEGLYIVTAYVSDKSGRSDASTGAVTINGKKGEDLANAIMKAETKAKRRATLSICGLGMLDETEAADIMSATPTVVVEAVTTKAADGSEINTVTGEVVDVNDGLLRIVSCIKQPTTSNRGCWLLKLSDGRECYSLKEQEASVADQFVQAQRPVVIDLKESKRGWDLVSLREFGKGPEVAEGDAAPAPPIDVKASDIAF